ncbi:pimeloyl-ACP methyl ester carboxylesterase [Paraburkholderia sp. GAS333]
MSGKCNVYDFAGQWRDSYEPSVQMLAGMYRGSERTRVACDSALLCDMILTQPVFYELPQIPSPTVLMIGDKDTTAIGKEYAPVAIRPSPGNFPEFARHAAAVIPDVKLIEFTDSGHAPQMREPALFHKVLLRELANGATLQ